MRDAAFDCGEKRTSNFLVVSCKLPAFKQAAELTTVHKQWLNSPVKSLFLEKHARSERLFHSNLESPASSANRATKKANINSKCETQSATATFSHTMNKNLNYEKRVNIY